MLSIAHGEILPHCCHQLPAIIPARACELKCLQQLMHCVAIIRLTYLRYSTFHWNLHEPTATCNTLAEHRDSGMRAIRKFEVSALAEVRSDSGRKRDMQYPQFASIWRHRTILFTARVRFRGASRTDMQYPRGTTFNSGCKQDM